jgi:hypothetical protein
MFKMVKFIKIILNFGVCILLRVFDQVYGLINFQCIYFRLKIVVRPKHVADNLNKIVKTIEIELR